MHPIFIQILASVWCLSIRSANFNSIIDFEKKMLKTKKEKTCNQCYLSNFFFVINIQNFRIQKSSCGFILVLSSCFSLVSVSVCCHVLFSVSDSFPSSSLFCLEFYLSLFLPFSQHLKIILRHQMSSACLITSQSGLCVWKISFEKTKQNKNRSSKR